MSHAHAHHTPTDEAKVDDALPVLERTDDSAVPAVENPEQLPVIEAEGLPMADADDTIAPPTDAVKPEMTAEEAQALIAQRQERMNDMFKRLHERQVAYDRANGITRMKVMGRTVAVKKRKSKFR